ncbi:hypothetical protein JVT61DRAFT_10877 [Boletus reticuloceps]|uniref:Uncharacterized protein n=1 Tax=Boletus reticuloceps TaxID=495285 RepID=A0A8I2YFG4_9AGAM|nr:hypothetical protein JVT61DRAFT_10877 [Boletus reticuloceps]
MDDWTGQGYADKEDDGEEDPQSHNGSKKKGTGVPPKAKVRPKPPPPAAKPSISAYRPAVSAEQEEDFVANLLGGVDRAPILAAPMRSKKRKPSPILDSDDLVPDHSSLPASYVVIFLRGALGRTPYHQYRCRHRPRLIRVLVGCGVQAAAWRCLLSSIWGSWMPSFSEDVFDASMDFSGISMNFDFMDVDDIRVKPSLPVKKEQPPVKLNSKPVYRGATAPKKDDFIAPSWLSVYDSLSIVSKDSLGSKPTFSSKTPVNALEDDGSLRMFWLDYLEHGGKLYLVGKVKDETSNVWASACLSIQGIRHNLFVPPRSLCVVQEESEGD